MTRRRRRRTEGDGPTLNLAAMLDMAFQLLAFFVMTFKPQPIEYALGLKLPKAEAVKAQNQEVKISDDAGPSAIAQIQVAVTANAEGGIAAIVVEGGTPAGSVAELQQIVQQKITAAAGGIDRVLLELDPRLKMASFAQLLERCTAVKLPGGERLTKVSPVIAKGPPK